MIITNITFLGRRTFDTMRDIAAWLTLSFVKSVALSAFLTGVFGADGAI